MANPYIKQNFIDGDVLHAKELNVIEKEIYDMSLEVDVFVQEEEPEAPKEGDVWIKPTDEYGNIVVQLPKYNIEKDIGKVLTINQNGKIIWSIPEELKELPNGEEIYW